MHNKILNIISVFALSIFISACITQDPNIEGIALSGGNAIAHNTALQVVAPWPQGVHDTNLIVPADRQGADQSPPAENANAAPEAN